MPRLPYKTNLFGIPVTVVSDEQAEKARMRVCAPWDSPALPGDVKVACGTCGAALRMRPHPPFTPLKICIFCALAILPGKHH